VFTPRRQYTGPFRPKLSACSECKVDKQVEFLKLTRHRDESRIPFSLKFIEISNLYNWIIIWKISKTKFSKIGQNLRVLVLKYYGIGDEEIKIHKK